MGRLTLVLGGARSGKSAFAERLATAAGARVLYVATAEAGDQEMGERIRLHQARRPRTWQTVEAPLNPALAIEVAGGEWDAILLDSAAVWLANCLIRHVPEAGEPDHESLVTAEANLSLEFRRLTATIQTQTANCIVVSDEAGLGIVPAHALGRIFRDLLGTMNQCLAAEAAEAYLLVAGLPVQLKSLAGRDWTGRIGEQ